MSVTTEILSTDYVGDSRVVINNNFTNLEVKAQAINVKTDYSAVGDGVTDDTTAIQNAIDFCEANDRALFFPAGTYLTSGLTIATGLHLFGESIGTVNNTSTKSAASTVIKSNTTSSTVIRVIADSSGDIVKNLIMENICIDGDNKAHKGIHASTIYSSVFRNIIIRACAGTSYGFLLDNDNGNLSLHNLIENVHYNSTANAAAQNSSGFGFLCTDASGGGCVQNRIYSCSSFTDDGNGFYINGSDNNQFNGINAFRSGTGEGMILANDGAGPTAARNNFFTNCIVNITAKTGTYGNVFDVASSEGKNITVETDAQIHYSVIDYVEASIYETHKYKTSDWYAVESTALHPTGTASAGLAASLWGGVELPAGSNGGFAVTLPAQYGWKNGKIIAIELGFIKTSSTSSDDIYMRARGVRLKSNAAVATPNFDINETITLVDNANRYQYHEIDLTGNEIDLENDTDIGAAFNISRQGSNVLDTAASSVYVVSVRFKFLWDGPINGQTIENSLPYKDF